MKCPSCGSSRLRVVDTKPLGSLIWRRRKCHQGHQFHTEEILLGASCRKEAQERDLNKLKRKTRELVNEFRKRLDAFSD